MEKRPGHGKRVQNNQKNSRVNNNIIITRVTVICLKTYRRKMVRTASVKSRGVKYRPGGGTVISLLCFFFLFLKPRQVKKKKKGSTGVTVQVQLCGFIFIHQTLVN